MASESESSYFLGTLNYYYNLLLMTTKGRCIVVTVLVTAGSILLYRWRNENNKKQITPEVQKVPDLNELHRKMREEREREERQYEEERNLKLSRRNEEKRAKTERSNMEITVNDREDELNFMRKKHEIEERMRKLMEEKRNDQLVKDKLASLDQERLRNQGKLALEGIERNIERSREIHRRNVAELDNKFHENQDIFEKQESLRKEEILEQEERFERRRREIEEQLERDLEEMRRRNQQRRNEMDEQLRQIRMILQMKIWNEVIESNWTKRLNSLRSSNQDIEKLYSQMTRNQDRQLLKSQTNSLLAAVDHQKTLMENEKNEMERMYREYGKSFLLVIKDSVDDVSSQCDRTLYVLKHEPTNSAKIDECVAALSKITMSIPTLAELKRQWKDGMV
ncbi:hypothetical protein GCK72_018307 [Caenorhabditis remanei]|uniref:Uncharacterized protein n=1 Tax=Caenorhabditis remanei TaxID=31234 RepID=A0A6A5GAQ7_CAERE|nr:hypothetical protein GCK72_018307 [Caenorhabditis remanei]KAF1751753.1 hypothetical protein GCK72_018307 [Caenorhabditis remanei]